MNDLRTEVNLFMELGSIYKKYGVVLKLIPYNKNRHYLLYANDEIVFKNYRFSPKLLLRILQDKNDGLYSEKYQKIIQKIELMSSQVLTIRA